MGYDKSISPPSVRPSLLSQFPFKTLVQRLLSTIQQQFNQHLRFSFPISVMDNVGFSNKILQSDYAEFPAVSLASSLDAR